MTSGRYLLDKDTGGTDRLDLLASLGDTRTTRRLEALGITEGWECLELGPGTGTVALWMAERVAPSGHVVAVDIDTSKMAGKEHPALEVQQADLAVADLGTNRFDLITERAVLLWIPEAEAVLERAFTALKPGGWILVQEGWPLREADPSSPAELADAWARLYREVGARQAEFTRMRDFGKEAFAVLRRIGFEDVEAHGELTPVVGGTAQARFRKETMRSSLAGLAAQGLADRAALEPLLEIFDDPRFVLWQAIAMQVWGRKPA